MQKVTSTIYLMIILTGVIFVVSLPACKKDPQPRPYLGYNYFPVDSGKWVIYTVDSIAYNEFTESTDTFKFQLKETIESEFKDEEGRISQRIERYRRTSDTENWKLKDVWISTLTTARAEKVEENIKYVKLVFPVRKDKSWNGNAFNTEEEWNYQYIETHVPKVINNIAFDSTLTVLQKENSNLIETVNYREIYAANIGLVSKEMEDIKTEVNGTIKSGYKFSQRVISYGN